MKKLSIAALALLLSAPAFAVQPDEMLKDPALEARARVISKDLRCLVCQNQSIDDSDAPLARDLRVIVRERLAKGDSNQGVVDYVVSRYGEFVLLNPRFGWHTLVLWALPALVVLGGLLAAYRRRSAPQAAPSPLNAEEEARLKALTGQD